jgi:hypothetical protein
MKINDNNKEKINGNSEKQNIEVNTNNKIPVNEEVLKLPSPSLQEWKVPIKLAKIKDEYNRNDKSYSYTNYCSSFHLHESNNDNDDKDIIKILKEINRREDATVLVKEVRKKMRIINSEKRQLWTKFNNMKEQAKED